MDLGAHSLGGASAALAVAHPHTHTEVQVRFPPLPVAFTLSATFFFGATTPRPIKSYVTVHVSVHMWLVGGCGMRARMRGSTLSTGGAVAVHRARVG